MLVGHFPRQDQDPGHLAEQLARTMLPADNVLPAQ
jgi:hypothetical protein